jgi:hypothetical protein
MGPWASAIVAIAATLAVFFAVMGFRGLIDAIDHYCDRCGVCGRTTLLPLPLKSQKCWRCHYGQGGVLHLIITHLPVRH